MYTLIVFAPLAGSIFAGALGNFFDKRIAQFITTGLLLLSAILSAYAFHDVVFNNNVQSILLSQWVNSGALDFQWSLKIDALTAVMLVVVTSVSALVHIYSIGYMSGDPNTSRFFSYLSLFTFAMLMLVTSDNLVQMFFGWEGVGLASYLLIGFWYERPSANAAAFKAFIVNRIGDFGFSLGILAVFYVFGTVNLDIIFQQSAFYAGTSLNFFGYHLDALTVIGFLLFVGAMGKSAQLGLHTWLPDAMEGPTPVSALIHAATMVTAGVFLVCRMSPLYEFAPQALSFITIVGAATAFVAATIGLVQTDIKRVIAYSTCSQLGYMFLAAGLSAYGAAMFHLFTHAFFKALLFLGAGSVIHAVAGEQDMTKMGGLRPYIPVTYLLMIIGTLSLTGFPGMAGFYSKDVIIEAAYTTTGTIAHFAWLSSLLVVFLTSFYSWRLIFMTFHGANKTSERILKHIHESPMIMMCPLIVLGLGAVAAGFVFSSDFVGESHLRFWGGSLFVLREDILAVAHDISWTDLTGKWLPTLMTLTGFLFAYTFYVLSPRTPERVASVLRPVYSFLVHKWYFDELYDWIIVRPTILLGRFLWKFGDGTIIDGLGPDGISSAIGRLGTAARRLQTGYIHHYAVIMLVGLVAFVGWFLFMPGGFGS